MNVFEMIGEYLQFPFVQRALIVSVLVALCSSLLGVTLVLKRFSFIGDGLSHVAFGAMAVAAATRTLVSALIQKIASGYPVTKEFLTSYDMVITLAITILAAVLLLRPGKKRKIKGDAAVAMLSVGALAFGYLILNLFPTSGNLSGDVCTTLFGAASILSITDFEVVLTLVLSAAVVAFFLFFYHKIFVVTFDEDFAKATGIRSNLYNLLIAIVVAVVIVLAMDLVGSLLISALVIFPALSAMRVFKSFRSVTIASAVIAVLAALLGILVSLIPIGDKSLPVGSTIVAVNLLAFLGCCLAGFIRRRVK